MRRDVDERVEAVARRQHGVLTAAQVAAAGGDDTLRRRRVRSGAWRQVAGGVFVLAGVPESWRQHVMAAVLEAGDGAVASHTAAAVLLGIPGFDEGWPQTQKLRGRGHRSRLSTLHETFWLPPHHRTVVDGIPCTSLARTVFDLAGCTHEMRVERALDNCLARLGLDIARVNEVLAAVGRSGKPGTAVMRRLVEARTGGYVPTESELEALLVAVIESHGLRQPERQVDLGDDRWIGRLDFLYRPERVILEADGRPYHLALLDKERDEARRARLEAEGWIVIVVTWRQLVDEPELVARRIRAALRRATASAA